jgi:uncharacterized RDD family membrane protein YckC
MQEIFCSKCGTKNTGAGGFCQSCGAALGPSAAMAPATAVQPAYAPPVAQAFAPPSPYAGFWIRLLAHIIDHVVLGLAAGPLYIIMVLPAVARLIHEAQSGGTPEDAVMAIVTAASGFALIVFAGSWLYEALLTSSAWQGTVGKRLLRLKVTDQEGNRIGFGRATGRFFAKILSQMILWIGFIMIGFTDRKRGLHDMVAGTLVMKY